MIPVFQTRFDRRANCLAACIASLLEVPLAEVDFSCADHPQTWDDVAREKLRPYGLSFVHVVCDQFNACPVVHGEVLFIAHGPSERGIKHACIYRSKASKHRLARPYMELVHDPWPATAITPIGLRVIFEASFLVPIACEDFGKGRPWTS